MLARLLTLNGTMMHILHDRAALAELLGRSPGLHLYSLGDLDDAYWPRTLWFGGEDGEVALLYAAPGTPVLLAFTERPVAMRELLGEALPLLPRRFHAHLSPGLEAGLTGAYDSELHGEYARMVLPDGIAASRVDTGECEPLGFAHRSEVQTFYAEAYPGNWFDPAMLHSGQYFGIRRNAMLAAVAGVHVFSPRYRVAALGNIATHPAFRGQGLGTAVTARLCTSLRGLVHVIGLNVKADNRAAISCYARLGFEPVAPFLEYTFTALHGG